MMAASASEVGVPVGAISVPVHDCGQYCGAQPARVSAPTSSAGATKNTRFGACERLRPRGRFHFDSSSSELGAAGVSVTGSGLSADSGLSAGSGSSACVSGSGSACGSVWGSDSATGAAESVADSDASCAPGSSTTTGSSTTAGSSTTTGSASPVAASCSFASGAALRMIGISEVGSGSSSALRGWNGSERSRSGADSSSVSIS